VKIHQTKKVAYIYYGQLRTFDRIKYTHLLNLPLYKQSVKYICTWDDDGFGREVSKEKLLNWFDDVSIIKFYSEYLEKIEGIKVPSEILKCDPIHGKTNLVKHYIMYQAWAGFCDSYNPDEFVAIILLRPDICALKKLVYDFTEDILLQTKDNERVVCDQFVVARPKDISKYTSVFRALEEIWSNNMACYKLDGFCLSHEKIIYQWLYQNKIEFLKKQKFFNIHRHDASDFLLYLRLIKNYIKGPVRW